MLRERRIPPHPRAPFRTNRKFPLSEKMRMKIPEVELPFETHSQKGDKKRRILLNNFDASVSLLAMESFVDLTDGIKYLRVVILAS